MSVKPIPMTPEERLKAIGTKAFQLPGVTPEPPKRTITAQPYKGRDPATIPPRPWLYGRTYARGIVSVLVAPGGVGKSTLMLTEAVAMASGRELLGVKIHGGRALRVAYLNGEDSADELERRAAAIFIGHDLDHETVADRLFILSGHDYPLKIIVPGDKGSHVVNSPDATALETFIRDNRIDVFMADPAIDLHACDENSNGAMDALVKTLSRIGAVTGCAMALAHHARKPGASSGETETRVEDARGAKALIDGARVARVLNVMRKDEAEQVGVDDADRFRYFRADDGKANLAPRAGNAKWFFLETVPLKNGTDLYPAGDEIGCAKAWEMPGLLDSVTVADVRAVQRKLALGDWRVSVQSAEWAGHAVADVLGLDADDSADKTKIKKLLAAWVKGGALRKEQRLDRNRKSRPCYVPGEPVGE
jgi:hypothetical protein